MSRVTIEPLEPRCLLSAATSASDAAAIAAPSMNAAGTALIPPAPIPIPSLSAVLTVADVRTILARRFAKRNARICLANPTPKPPSSSIAKAMCWAPWLRPQRWAARIQSARIFCSKPNCRSHCGVFREAAARRLRAAPRGSSFKTTSPPALPIPAAGRCTASSFPTWSAATFSPPRYARHQRRSGRNSTVYRRCSVGAIGVAGDYKDTAADPQLLPVTQDKTVSLDGNQYNANPKSHVYKGGEETDRDEAVALAGRRDSSRRRASAPIIFLSAD